MTSDPDAVREDPLDLPDLDSALPDEAPEADVLDQRLAPTGYDPEPPAESGLPVEADPADVDEQRRTVGDPGEDDYR